MKNSVQLIGRLGADPTIRNTGSGKSVCNLSLATTEKWKNEQNELQERTQWHHVVLWGKSAEVAGNSLKKGELVAIDGRIEYRKFKDKDGKDCFATDIVADQFYFINPKKAENQP